MEQSINGIHHVTAIAGNAKTNHDFYTRILGLRLVKKTVNFDDPGTYHFYYGDETGTPGTILTFFPWQGITRGRRGARQATETGFSVPADSLEFWQNRMEENHILYNKPSEKFGEKYLVVLDPDGLKLELTVSQAPDNRRPWETADITVENAIRGFHHVTITTHNIAPTANILTSVFGYRLLEKHVNRHRFITDVIDHAAILDLVEVPGEKPGLIAGGSVHHVAFSVKNREIQMHYHEKISKLGLNITEQIDRQYFYSLYFREPGGVLFEIATEEPGFTIDEAVDELGTHLKLPPQYEQYRSEIEKTLPPL